MSRCFPYPQPGHQRISEPLAAAAKSIKLQNEPKREKQRKLEKKEKIKRGDKSRKHNRDLDKVEPVHKKRMYDNGGELCEKKISPKEAGKFVMEQLENSGLSEEHGLPSSILEPCESWESTQSSSKNRKLAPTRSHGGLILRIKLPLQNHKSPDLDTPRKVPVLERKDPPPVSSNDLVLKEQNVPECAPATEEPCFSGRFNEASSMEKEDGKTAHGHSGSRKSKSLRRSEEMERQIRNLITNWKPAQLQGSESVDDDDQGWLFGRQQYKDPCARGCGLDSRVEDISSEKGAVASYQPSACFMPEFNAYQMPYVFPF